MTFRVLDQGRRHPGCAGGLLPSTRERTGKATERGALWWMIVDRFVRAGIPVVAVQPASLKLWATSDGHAPKEHVRSRMVADWGWEGRTVRLDESDAWAAASLGCQVLGLPVPWEVTDYRRDVVSGLTIPEGLEAA